jgi:hypothetical protein
VLVPQKDWQRARDRSTYGEGDASGTYSFEVRGGSKSLIGVNLVGVNFAGWRIGGVEFEVHNNQLRFRTGSKGSWENAVEVSVPSGVQSIRVRATVRAGEVSHEINDKAAGSPVKIGSGPFELPKGASIRNFLYTPF